MKNFTITCAFLLSITLGFISCKKDSTTNPENPLLGTWEELDLTSVSRSINFNNDNTFILSIGYNKGGSTLISGTYTLEGRSLITKSMVVQEQEPGMSVVKSPANGELYKDATFSISGDILTLRYTSYPADAPVSTTATFKKRLKTD